MDLSYITQGMWTRFLPESKAGEAAWSQMGDGTVILTMHLKNVLAQLRRAGYSVQKAKPVKMTMTDEELLAELMV